MQGEFAVLRKKLQKEMNLIEEDTNHLLDKIDNM